MFYISKLTPTYVFVTDSDDNITERLTRTDFWKYVEQGIMIKGVKGNYIQKSNGTYTVDNWALEVYNPNPTGFEAKQSLMNGCSLQIENNVLLSLAVHKITNPIRLSIFCDKVADYCFHNGNMSEYNQAVLIIDGKIKEFSKKAFKNYSHYKIVIEDGTLDAVADSIYNGLLHDYHSFSSTIEDFDKSRLFKWQFEQAAIKCSSVDKIVDIRQNYTVLLDEMCSLSMLAYNYYKDNRKKILDYLKLENKDNVIVDSTYYTASWAQASRVFLNNAASSISNIRSYEYCINWLELRFYNLDGVAGFIRQTNIKNNFLRCLLVWYYLDDYKYKCELSESLCTFIYKLHTIYRKYYHY